MVSRRRVARFAIAFALLCPLAVGVASAQRQEARSWIRDYERYVGPASANGARAEPSGSARVALKATIRAAF